MSIIIGRKLEIEELERHYNSDRPEFVAIYGCCVVTSNILTV